MVEFLYKQTDIKIKPSSLCTAISVVIYNNCKLSVTLVKVVQLEMIHNSTM